MTLKRLILPAALVVTFLATFNISAAFAWPDGLPYSMVDGYGYFYGQYDRNGDRVLPEYRSGGVCVAELRYWNGLDDCNAVPNWVNSKANLIFFLENRLQFGSEHERIGAAFIIQTFIGQARDVVPTPAQLQEFRDRVNASPRIDFFTYNFDWQINSLNQRGRTGSGVQDVTLYWESSGGNVITKSGELGIVFYNAANQRIYAIKTRCANPVGQPGTLGNLEPAPQYNMSPTVAASQTTAQEGDTVQFTYTADNIGTGNSPSITCSITDGSGGTVGMPATNCPRAFPWSDPPSAVTAAPESVTIGGQPAGSQICRRLVLSPASSTVGSITSPPACVTIVKTPYVHMMGNDVWAGGGFAAVNPACDTSAKITSVGRTLAAGARAGSVSEYHTFALNQITGFGSGSRPLVGSGTLGGIGRGLTFANNETVVSRVGFYGAASHCIPDYTALYASAPGSPPAVTAATDGAWRVNGAYTLAGGVMPAASQKVYYVVGDVTIPSNITYPGSYANASQIPSLVVIATGNIYVQAGVTQLDGQFIARGTFFSCHPKIEPATVSICNNPLTINGSVMATNLDLFRTRGADGASTAQRQTPAEMFNFSPEVYLRSALNSSSQTTIQVTNTTELPPRF